MKLSIKNHLEEAYNEIVNECVNSFYDNEDTGDYVTFKSVNKFAEYVWQRFATEYPTECHFIGKAIAMNYFFDRLSKDNEAKQIIR
jgi:hypothetical protein